MDDYYYDEEHEESEDYDQTMFLEEHSVTAAFQTCVQPSVAQISQYVVILLVWSVLCRCLLTCTRRYLAKSEWMQHSISLLCGFATLYFTMEHEFLIVLLMCLLLYVLMLTIEYHKNGRGIGITVAVVAISAHFAYESLWHKPESWQRIRGIQMVATMKIISLAFDLESVGQKDKPAPVPALVPYLGYLFYPATCVLGPWIPYSVYLRSLRKPCSDYRWLLWSILNAALAVTFLSLSNCIVPLLCSDRAWTWLRTYRDALSVRCSHYFICFLSQATISAAGVDLRIESPPNALVGHMVTQPWRIECPRSISALVRVWNIPMHDWLKTYIFRAAHQRFAGSYFVAVISTYLVSSLLHGLHLRIYLVLLSLGCFAYVESILRAKLALIFNACIMSNSCRKPCQFTHCLSHGWWNSGAVAVFLVNLLFGILAVFHLAYLGVMMSGGDADEKASSVVGGLWKWSELDYASHWIALLTFIFYVVI